MSFLTDYDGRRWTTEDSALSQKLPAGGDNKT